MDLPFLYGVELEMEHDTTDVSILILMDLPFLSNHLNKLEQVHF